MEERRESLQTHAWALPTWHRPPFRKAAAAACHVAVWTGAGIPGETAARDGTGPPQLPRHWPHTPITASRVCRFKKIIQTGSYSLPRAFSVWLQKAVSTLKVCDGGSLPPVVGFCSRIQVFVLSPAVVTRAVASPEARGTSHSPLLTHTPTVRPVGLQSVGDCPAQTALLFFPAWAPPAAQPSRREAGTHVPPCGCGTVVRLFSPHLASHPASPVPDVSGPWEMMLLPTAPPSSTEA